jgi:hypothetical protein
LFQQSTILKQLRYLILFIGAGLVWYLGLNLFFIWSGAQGVLGNPEYQSSKFIKTFTEYEPLPLMAANPSIVWKGLLVVGLMAAIAFSIINPYLKGGWLKRGAVFGIAHWLLMTPWFEFYLPYNVMHEPILLVLLEAGLWLCIMLMLGLFMSFTLNYKRVSS